MSKRTGTVVVAVALVLAVGGCGGGADREAADASGGKRAEAASARPPSDELVRWVGKMCESTDALKDVRTDSAAQLKKIQDPDGSGPSGEHLASGYLFDTTRAVEDVQRDLEYLDPAGVPAGDRLLAAWQKKLKAVKPKLRELSWDADFEDYEKNAPSMDKLVQALGSPQPGLTAATEKDPRLAAAFERAKPCAPDWKPPLERVTPVPDPSDPLPKAADGDNTGACSDGECEVLVTSSVDVTAQGLKVRVTVDEDDITFRTASSSTQLGGQGGGGKAEFGENGKELTVIVIAHNAEGAVLYFTAS